MALVLAVVTTTVVTIMVVAMLSFTSASSRDASLKDARQSASALAEAGVGQALAQLASHYYRENSPNVPARTCRMARRRSTARRRTPPVGSRRRIRRSRQPMALPARTTPPAP